MVAMMPLHATTARLERSTLLPTLKKSGRPRDARGRFIRHHERLPVSLADTRGALFVVSEMADFIKAGGLGDVAAALPRALRHRYDVRVLIPGYRAVLERAGKVEIVGRVLAHAALPACDIGRIVQSDGLPIYILLSKELFERDGSPYVSTSGSEFEDNAIRFATLSHAAAQIAAGHAGLGWKPRLLHLNDWPCALAAGYVRWSGGTTPCLLTIHNLAYQGLVPYSMAAALGIPAERVAELEFYGQMSFLRGGIVNADHVNTVSVSYAKQITGPAQGCGLDRLLAGAPPGRAHRHRQRHRRQLGPAHRPIPGFALQREPMAGPPGQRSAGTQGIRAARERWPTVCGGLAVGASEGPGPDLRGGPANRGRWRQIAVIGGGEPEIEQQVAELTRRYPGQVGAFIGFEEGLARRMFAGADFLLMPSRFEPCGLSQMYAQRFGCLPIAHATGGLIDTVDDGVTGFLFQHASVEALRRCLERAFRTFRLPSLLSAMRRAAMLRPSGWDVAGKKYLSLYEHTAATAPALATVP